METINTEIKISLLQEDIETLELHITKNTAKYGATSDIVKTQTKLLKDWKKALKDLKS